MLFSEATSFQRINTPVNPINGHAPSVIAGLLPVEIKVGRPIINHVSRALINNDLIKGLLAIFNTCTRSTITCPGQMSIMIYLKALSSFFLSFFLSFRFKT